jgi:hypothetical protein
MCGDEVVADRGALPDPVPEAIAGDEPDGVVAFLALHGQ